MASKILTRDQAQAKKDQAVRFADNVLDDPDLADTIEAEGLDDWVQRKKITLIENNPKRSLQMAGNGNGDPRTKTQLLDTIDDLQQQVDELNDTLDSIMDLAGSGPSDDDDTDDGDDDQD